MCTLCALGETIMNLCAKRAHRMGGSDDPRRVHFQSPAYLVERLDAIADLFDKDRTDVLVEAIREYIEDTADSETFQELVAAKFYDDQLLERLAIRGVLDVLADGLDQDVGPVLVEEVGDCVEALDEILRRLKVDASGVVAPAHSMCAFCA